MQQSVIRKMHTGLKEFVINLPDQQYKHKEAQHRSCYSAQNMNQFTSSKFFSHQNDGGYDEKGVSAPSPVCGRTASNEYQQPSFSLFPYMGKIIVQPLDKDRLSLSVAVKGKKSPHYAGLFLSALCVFECDHWSHFTTERISIDIHAIMQTPRNTDLNEPNIIATTIVKTDCSC